MGDFILGWKLYLGGWNQKSAVMQRFLSGSAIVLLGGVNAAECWSKLVFKRT